MENIDKENKIETFEQVHVTVLRFRVSNKASTKYNDDENTKWYAKEVKELSSAAQITETLEEFMQGRILVSCETTPVTCKHNNDRDRDDTVDLIYTIFWKEGPNFREMELERRRSYSALEESFEKINEEADIQKEKEYEKQKQKGIGVYGYGTNRQPQENYSYGRNGQIGQYTQQNQTFQPNQSLMNQNMYGNMYGQNQGNIGFNNGQSNVGQLQEDKYEYNSGMLNVPNGLGRKFK